MYRDAHRPRNLRQLIVCDSDPNKRKYPGRHSNDNRTSPKSDGRLGKMTTADSAKQPSTTKQRKYGFKLRNPILNQVANTQDPWAKQDDNSFPMVTASGLLLTDKKHLQGLNIAIHHDQQSSTINMTPRVVYNAGIVFR